MTRRPPAGVQRAFPFQQCHGVYWTQTARLIPAGQLNGQTDNTQRWLLFYVSGGNAERAQ